MLSLLFGQGQVNGIDKPAKIVVIELLVVAVSVMLTFVYLQRPHDFNIHRAVILPVLLQVKPKLSTGSTTEIISAPCPCPTCWQKPNSQEGWLHKASAGPPRLA